MTERKDSDPCEKCGVHDGATVNGSELVCFKCDRKLKKEARQLKREIYYGRKQKVRQRASQDFRPKRTTRDFKSPGRGK